MAIGPVNRVGSNPSIDPDMDQLDRGVTTREVIVAIRGLNGSAFMGERRELRSRRNRDGRLQIEVIDRETGEVLGELPPHDVLHMADELHREQTERES